MSRFYFPLLLRVHVVHSVALNNNAFVVNEDEDDDDDERDDRLIVPFGGYFDQVGVDDESNDDDELAIFVPDSVWPFVTHDDADAENDVRTSDVRKTKRTEPRSNDEYDDDDDQEYPLYGEYIIIDLQGDLLHNRID